MERRVNHTNAMKSDEINTELCNNIIFATLLFAFFVFASTSRRSLLLTTRLYCYRNYPLKNLSFQVSQKNVKRMD